jgi:hypothetical protein
MGIEFDIAKELATINMTLTELSSITGLVNGAIRSGDFYTRYNRIVTDIVTSYHVVTHNLSPFTQLDTESKFEELFDARHAAYTERYLVEISRPRASSEDAYEEYLELKTLKESKTSYPLLKRTFERFDHFIDKWITNDAWLAMCIDNLLKRMQALLNEIAALKKKDIEDAFLIYHAACSGFEHYLALIDRQRKALG